MADYTSLIADIKSWTENESVELSAAIPTIIGLGEFRCARELAVRQFEHDVAGAFAIGAETVPIPADLTAMVTFEVPGVVTGGLEQRTREYLKVYWPMPGTVGVPKYYAVNDAISFLIAPTPSTTAAYTIHYRRRLPALSVGNPTNWLTTDAYDALLYACLAEAAVYVLDDRQAGLIQIYEGKWAEKRDAVMRVEAWTRRDQSRTPAVMAANV